MKAGPNDPCWQVPTPGEVSDVEAERHSRDRGPLAWVRKLRMRSNIGVQKQVTRPPSLGKPPPAEPEQAPAPQLPPPSSPITAEAPSPPAPLSPPSVTAPPPGASLQRRRPVRISDEALRRRTGTKGVTPQVAPIPERLLTPGEGFGRCSCGDTFYGPPDAVRAAFAGHTCGVDRGIEREGWMFDR